MANVIVNETNLTNIANAIREKNGETTSYKPSEMAGAILAIQAGGGSGGGIEVEPIVLTGDQSYSCYGSVASAYIKHFGDTISTDSITNAYNMFKSSTLESIPFDINCSTKRAVSLSNMFAASKKLTNVPKINNAMPSSVNSMFSSCESLREIPYEVFNNWNCSSMTGDCSGIFTSCYSLRRFPNPIFQVMVGQTSAYDSIFYQMLNSCYAIDEVVGMPAYMPKAGTAITGNMFNSTFRFNMRIARITFETNEDGSAKVVQWKSQTIDLSNSGFSNGYPNVLLNYNSGITADKVVKDAETYEALKNDPDWCCQNSNYARYNKTSALETIATLPDTSAYLVIAGGTNTIKFKGDAGALTDGGAINTLTEEEIAVATAKGWTVTLV